MRTPAQWYAVSLVALGFTACAANDVRSVASPDANPAALRTFRLMPAPRVRPGVGQLPADDPMLAGSMTNRALRQALMQAFEGRGYVVTERSPDFLVAYYASLQQPLDVMWWDYGYAWRPEWWRGWGTRQERCATTFEEGTVIVDVLDAQQQLLWRGRGVAAVSGTTEEYLADLRRVVTEMLNTFPAAQPPEAVTRALQPARPARSSARVSR
jgi:hypothetical protein